MEDMDAGEEILALDRMGIDSAKVEGRLKSPEYYAYVARYYRGILDRGYVDEKERENANVQNAGWLYSFDADYHYRGSDLHYHVNVSAALSEGGTVWWWSCPISPATSRRSCGT